MKEFNLSLGTPVHCQDGQCGKLAKVGVDSETLRVTELIVEEGFLLKHDRVFPISLVEYTTEEIVLSIDSSQAATEIVRAQPTVVSVVNTIRVK